MQPNQEIWTIKKVLVWTTSYFQSHNIDSPRLAAEILLAHTLQLKRLDLYLRYDQPLIQKELSDFKALIKRRLAREPVAYIIGSKDFWSKSFIVTPDVLIPRPDTECLVETALSLLKQSDSAKHILELGVGAGAVIVSIASEQPEHEYTGIDISPKALEIAIQNAKNCNPENKIRFLQSNWFDCFKTENQENQENKEDQKKFDMIMSNPPYIPTQNIPELEPEIKSFEPISALDGGSNGLKHITHIINTAYDFLKPTGHLLLEIGYDQKDSVIDIVKSSNKYLSVECIKDYAGNDRVMVLKT